VLARASQQLFRIFKKEFFGSQWPTGIEEHRQEIDERPNAQYRHARQL